ncbi:hypothetical protein JHK85_045781 [Glycine max]|nr:hypothetical protein JHK85_045781 [Glycine max]
MVLAARSSSTLKAVLLENLVSAIKYGMAYAAVSTAIGVVFLWSYVYNIMRISSSRIQKEDNTSKDSNMLKASADISESHPHNFSETLYPTKDTMDDAYTILLPETNSEEKIAGFIIGVVPQIRNFIIGNNVPLHVVEDSSFHVGALELIFKTDPEFKDLILACGIDWVFRMVSQITKN